MEFEMSCSFDGIPSMIAEVPLLNCTQVVLGSGFPFESRRESVRLFVFPLSESKNVVSGMTNWNTCPSFTRSMPIGFNSIGGTFGEGVSEGMGEGVDMGEGTIVGVGVMDSVISRMVGELTDVTIGVVARETELLEGTTVDIKTTLDVGLVTVVMEIFKLAVKLLGGVITVVVVAGKTQV